jgi:hypothetical protein
MKSARFLLRGAVVALRSMRQTVKRHLPTLLGQFSNVCRLATQYDKEVDFTVEF